MGSDTDKSKHSKMGFRDNFKFYKRKNVLVNLENVFDFNSIKNNIDRYEKDISVWKSSQLKGDISTIFGLKNPSEWKIYEFKNKPGLLFIQNPFKGSGQRYWIIRCLRYYTKKPNKLNIDAHNLISANEDWWDVCLRELNTEKGGINLEKLRWATLGYHHNWDTKRYTESSKSIFPSDLWTLCDFMAKTLGFSDFSAEAAIINMYHFGSTLSGHSDHSEVNSTAPLFSFSFGQSAIFLIGGKSMDDEAIPVLLESGDVVIMSGESRLCYHGIPRILPAEKFSWRDQEEEELIEKFDDKHFLKEIIDNMWNDSEWRPFERYISRSRINMNVRQVLIPGQKSLDDAINFS